jgi:putative flippase GtrA
MRSMLKSAMTMVERPASLHPVIRFGLVGVTGLASDMGVFTLLHQFGANPLIIRIISLGFATLVTWLLNRQFTFEKQKRAVGHEAARYIGVTVFAQGVSYLTFAGLITLFSGFIPQAAMLIGAIIGAAFSFQGHKFVSFAPIVRDAENFVKGDTRWIVIQKYLSSARDRRG